MHGNQYVSRKRELLSNLAWVKFYLRHGFLESAKTRLNEWREDYDRVPASTRRRWKCGR